MRRPCSYALAAAFLAAASYLPAQERVIRADSLTRAAIKSAEAGDTTRALKLLEQANKVAPKYAPAFFQRGLLLSRTSELGLSDMHRRRSAFKDIIHALDLDNNNPFYLMELGRLRLKTPFMRLEAERLFKKALRAAQERKDPRVLAEVHWELGQIHERRYVTMANRRIITNSAATLSADAAMADWRYAREFLEQYSHPVPDAGELDFRKAEDQYRAALESDRGHAGAGVGLLGLLYDAKRYEEMVTLASQLRAMQPREARVGLALGLGLHRLDRDLAAEAVFDSALTLLAPEERRDMVGVETILRKEAAGSYTNLSESDRAHIDSLYWDVSDPLKLTKANEARVEFYSRVAYADLRYSSPEFHTHGWHTDRGEILIRYGEPPQIATIAPEVTEIEGSDGMARVTTLWWYPETKLRFVFVGPPAMNYAFFAGDFRSYAEDARFVAPVRFDNLKRLLRVDSVQVQVARFRADGVAGADVSVFADIPTGQMMRDVDVVQGTLETGFFLSDGTLRAVAEQRDSSVLRIRGVDQLNARAWRRVLSPGEYRYRVEAREPGSGRSARGMASFEVPTFAKGAFSLSDILVAKRIAPREGGGQRSRADFLITPSASMAFHTRDTVYIYWEMYGAKADSLGNAHLQVSLNLRVTELARGSAFEARVLGGIADAIGLSAKGDDHVSLNFALSLPLDESDRIARYLALNLGQAPAGSYLMELTVKDMNSGHTASQQRTITVPRP